MRETTRSTGVWLVSLGKDRQTSRVSMQEVTVSDGPYLALRKEACDGNRSQAFHSRSDVMVRSSKKPSTTAATAEHECAERRMPVNGSIGRQHRVQIFRG